MATICSENETHGSDEVYSLVCLPCHGDDVNVPAFGYCVNCQEHLCSSCYKYHKKATLSRHHTLQDKDNMPTTQALTDTSTSVEAGGAVAVTLNIPCPRHKNEMIKLYCNDHKELLCGICVALEHTKPCHVDYIPDISDKFIKSTSVNALMEKLNQLMKKSLTCNKETSKQTKVANRSLRNALQGLTRYRKTINKRLDKEQHAMEDKLRAFHHENDEQAMAVGTVCQSIEKLVNESNDKLKQLNNPQQAEQLFIEAKQIEKQIQEYEDRMKSITQEGRLRKYDFIPNSKVAEEDFNFGLLNQLCQGIINVKTSTDTNNCLIIAMKVFPPDRLVLCDFNNKFIKLVDVDSRSVKSQLSLGEDEPGDLTKVSDDQVAVTVPGKQHIQFVDVKDRLTKRHTIQTSGECHGICFHQNKLIVSYWEPGRFEILDMNGSVIREVETGMNRKHQLLYQVEATVSTIYILNDQLNIYQFDQEGEDTDTQAEIHIEESSEDDSDNEEEDDLCPRGFALLDGSLIICHRASNCVTKSPLELSEIVPMLANVLSPLAICVDDAGHKMYISSTFDGELETDTENDDDKGQIENDGVDEKSGGQHDDDVDVQNQDELAGQITDKTDNEYVDDSIDKKINSNTIMIYNME